MDKNSLGNKRICVGCGAKFYDLGKNPAPCPKCRTANDINAQFRVRRKSKATVEVDNDDPLIKQKAKQEAKQEATQRTRQQRASLEEQETRQEEEATQQQATQLADTFQLNPAGASLEQTMVAMQKSQIAFQSALHVRNRLVSAYSDIMNMQV